MITTVHPPKEHHLDLRRQRHQTAGHDVTCDVMTPYPFGLHVARSYPGHPHITYDNMLFLPELGIIAHQFQRRDGPGPERLAWYVDIVSMRPGVETWWARDLYLDVLIYTDGRVVIDDTDEYLAAVDEGLISAAEGREALRATHALVNGLATHRGDLLAFLAAQGITVPAFRWPALR